MAVPFGGENSIVIFHRNIAETIEEIQTKWNDCDKMIIVADCFAIVEEEQKCYKRKLFYAMCCLTAVLATGCGKKDSTDTKNPEQVESQDTTKTDDENKSDTKNDTEHCQRSKFDLALSALFFLFILVSCKRRCRKIKEGKSCNNLNQPFRDKIR